MSVSAPWLLRKAQLLRNQPERLKASKGKPTPPPKPPADPVDVSSDDSFPASDPPSFTPTSGSVHGPRGNAR